MGIAEPSGSTEKRRSELIGGLYLVGAKGKCCAVITERQLTIERFDGKGVRLELAAIERMRHLKIPMLPSGTVLLGIIAIYLGITTIVAPMSWLAVGLGASVIIANIVSRYAILAIETGSGDRHLVSGSESNLLKLCLIVDRVRHGSDIQEAILGLENLETELPTFPAIRDATGQLGQSSRVALPISFRTNDISHTNQDPESNLTMPTDADMKMFDFPKFAEDSELVREDSFETGESASSSLKQNAYERAWGVQVAPTWYKEKTPEKADESRIDSAFSDAAEGLDMFAPGGLFDSDPVQESSPTVDMGLFGFGSDATPPNRIERSQSSAQMIKRAHQELGAPPEPYSRPLLPPPTEEAVREECKAGVVRQAKARQELRIQNLNEMAGIHTANLEDYPALNKLASTMSGSRTSSVKSGANASGGWLSRLLRPGGSANRVNESNDETTNEIETESFQTTQHMRLRSDQDHQAEVSSRIRSMRMAGQSSTAKDNLNSIVRRLSGEEEMKSNLLDETSDSLKFSQLKPTSSREDPNPLPGLRRLG
ncbi:MAG TPA: DUF308 domain-containing protein [Candidatus Thalassarchaeaceae archaeon]|nr:DUF308 domain-containing protein [Candidatus Thalassarchaeaceae archaeon]